MRHILALLLMVSALGCAHEATEGPKGDNLIVSSYPQLIERNTYKTNRYSGLYQTFQVDITILTNEIQVASVEEKGHFLQWDQKRLQTEREKVLQENAAYSKFFMRFYSPEKDYDDLNKDKTIWRVYLDVNGQRFDGKVKKVSGKFVEIQTLYPYFDRFSTPYEVTFNVPMTTVQSGTSKVTLTSSLGTAEFIFPVKK